MLRSRDRIVFFLALACAAAPLAAQSHDDQALARLEWEQRFGRPKPVPTIPEPLRLYVSALNADWLAIRMADGRRHAFGIGAISPDEFESFASGRFIGFRYGGHEEFGYVLIDRNGRGELAEIATGDKPAFSEDGRHFAAAEISESGFGNLNGVALWEVHPAGVRRLFYTDSVRSGFHWRADNFVGPSCVRVSAVEEGWEPSAPDRWDQEVTTAPRAYYELRWSAEEGLYFGRSSDSACFDDSSG